MNRNLQSDLYEHIESLSKLKNKSVDDFDSYATMESFDVGRSINASSLISIGGLCFSIDGKAGSTFSYTTSASSIVTNNNSVGADSNIKNPSSYTATICIFDDTNLIGFLIRNFFFNNYYGDLKYSNSTRDIIGKIIIGMSTIIDDISQTIEENRNNNQSSIINTEYSKWTLIFIRYIFLKMYSGFTYENITTWSESSLLELVNKNTSNFFTPTDETAFNSMLVTQLEANMTIFKNLVYKRFYSSSFFSSIPKFSTQDLRSTEAFKNIFNLKLPKELYLFMLTLIIDTQRFSNRALSIHTPSKGWSIGIVESLKVTHVVQHNNMLKVEISYKNYEPIISKFFTISKQAIIDKHKPVPKNKENTQKKAPAKPKPTPVEKQAKSVEIPKNIGSGSSLTDPTEAPISISQINTGTGG